MCTDSFNFSIQYSLKATNCNRESFADVKEFL